MSKRKQKAEPITESGNSTKPVLGEVRAWPHGKLVKVIANDGWHFMPIGSIVEVVGEESDGSIMVNYLGRPKWAAPSELEDFA